MLRQKTTPDLVPTADELREETKATSAKNEDLARTLADHLRAENEAHKRGDLDAAMRAGTESNACAVTAAHNSGLALALGAYADTRGVFEREERATALDYELAACRGELADLKKKSAAPWRIAMYEGAAAELARQIKTMRTDADRERRVLKNLERWLEALDEDKPETWPKTAQEQARMTQKHWAACIAKARETGVLMGLTQTPISIW